jgi:hypothetical protein
MSKRSRYDGAISAGIITTSGDGNSYYDTNLSVSSSNDFGITKQGAHGYNASFTDVRSTKVLTGSTQDFMVGLVRGALTTGNIPLFVPLLNTPAGASPTPITENGVQMYETAIQPGLALTWTGPVYSTEALASGTQSRITVLGDIQFISWPTSGYIVWRSYETIIGTTNFGALIDSGVISLGSGVKGGGSTTVTTLVFRDRLNTLLAASSNGCPARLRTIDATSSGLQILQFYANNYTL